MDEFDRAVQVMYDSNTNDAMRREAEQRLNQIVDSQEGVRLVIAKVYDTAASDPVKLISINYIQKIIDLIAAHEAGFSQTEVPRFIIELVPEIKTAIASWPVKFLATCNPSPSVKNSFGHLLITLMKQLDVSEWSRMFDMLIGYTSSSEPILDFLLRVLQEFGEEVIDRQQTSRYNQQRVSLIKDELRISIVPKLADLWYTIMVSGAETRPTYVKMTLNVVRLFISWIDINLVATERYYNVFFQFLRNPAYLELAGGCINELIQKGMDPVPKMELVHSLGLPRLADATNADYDTAMCVSKIFTAAAIELSFCCEKLLPLNMEKARTAAVMIDELFPTLLLFLGNDNDEISETTYAFFHPYLTRYKASIYKPGGCKGDHLQALLPVVNKKIAYPTNYFEIKPGDDEMTQIEEFRKKIANLFKAIVKLSPEICITYIGTTIQRVAAGGASAFGFHEVESILFLYFLFAEALSNTSQSLDGPGSPSSSSSSSSALAGRSPAASPIPQVLEVPVQQILVTVINSDISQYQNQAVQLTYFEVIVRYLKYMPMGQECFEKVIASFLDGRGIRSTLPPVRRRVNYLFQRFAKTLKLQLHPYVAQIIDNIRPILALDTQQGFSPDDQMSLYEALGNIVGSRPPRYPDLTRDLLAPLVARQRELLTAGGLTTTTAAAAAAFFKLHLNAITVFSKGFALVGSSEEDRMVGACFLEAMGVAVQVLNALPTDASVWTHVSTLLHRVIETLGALAAQHIAPVLEALLRSFNAIYMSAEVPPQDKRTAFLSELVDMLTLEGQVSSKFKEAAGTVVGSTLVDLLLVPVTIVGPEIAKYTRDFVPTVPPPSPSSSSSSSPTSAATIFGGSSNSGSGSGGVRAAGEDLRELLVVHKTFMQCISTFMGNSGKYIMENRAFMGALPRFFDFVLCGLFIPVGANNNVQTQKGVVGFLLKCLDAWSVKAKMADFTAFANATVVPLLLKALVVRSNLAVNDASVHFLLEDCLRFLVLLAPLVGINEFAAGLAGVVLPGLSCPQQIANSFAQAVATCVMSHSNEDAKRALAMMKEMTKSSNY